jgi:hypothetical protein
MPDEILRRRSLPEELSSRFRDLSDTFKQQLVANKPASGVYNPLSMMPLSCTIRMNRPRRQRAAEPWMLTDAT